MKIAVCVKHVPDRQVRIDPASKRIDRSGSGEMNGFDSNAIEEALRIKDASGAEVVVVSMGPESAVETLRTALGLGADRAILIADAAVVGSDLVATAKVLAAALNRESPDLILFGQQASDGGGAVLWAAIADQLRRPVVSQVTELVVEDGRIRSTRQTEFGDEVVEAPMPAVVAVTDAINEPRYASLKGKMGAKKKPLDILSLSDLAVTPDAVGASGSKTVVLGLSEPPSRANAVKITDEGEAAQAIAEFLVERHLV